MTPERIQDEQHKTNQTYGEQFDSAMKCETPAQAQDWMRLEIEMYVRDWAHTPDSATSVILTNLGYMAGYYDHETAQKVKWLFNADHPIFRSADYHQTVEPRFALKLGQDAAKARTR